MMRSRGQSKKTVRNILFRIGMEELVENAVEVVEVKAIDYQEKLHKLKVRVQDDSQEYIVHAIIQLTRLDGYYWKLKDLWWEEVK